MSTAQQIKLIPVLPVHLLKVLAILAKAEEKLRIGHNVFLKQIYERDHIHPREEEALNFLYNQVVFYPKNGYPNSVPIQFLYQFLDQPVHQPLVHKEDFAVLT